MLSLMTVSAFAADMPKPESFAEKMTFKLARGVTNIVTSPAEIPKQIVLTGRNHGAIGYVLGPFKGIGMTAYRCFIGMAETVLFMVPQPGYYDPMMDPEYVWQGWQDNKREPLAKVEDQSVKEGQAKDPSQEQSVKDQSSAEKNTGEK
jgi:putative exosortase-associated protein (TIGR04073 family)